MSNKNSGFVIKLLLFVSNYKQNDKLIAVHSAEKVADAKVSHDDGQKCDDGKRMEKQGFAEYF